MVVKESEENMEMESQGSEETNVSQTRKRKSAGDDENNEENANNSDEARNWVCLRDNCGFTNYAGRQSCKMCHSNEDGSGGDAKEDDWSCKQCGYSNFASRRKCKKCQPSGGGGVDWKCSGCGASNFATRLNCRVCRNRNTGGAGFEGDWKCTKCTFTNFASRSNCKQCDALHPAGACNPTTTDKVKRKNEEAAAITTMKQLKAKLKKGSKSKPGDWTCLICNYLNFTSRFNCKLCSSAKPTHAGDSVPTAVVKYEDTDVSTSSTKPAKKRPKQTNEEVESTDESTFSGEPGNKRSKISQEVESTDGSTSSGEPAKKRPKISQGARPDVAKDGDWSCVGCGVSNFINRSNCRKCNEENPDGGGSDAALNSIDWPCSGCGFSNFHSRRKCKQCSQEKPATVEEPTATDGATSSTKPAKKQKKPMPVFGDKAGDWTCKKCSFGNFASRANCKQCSEAKPAGDSTTTETAKDTTDDSVKETADDPVKETVDDTMKDTADNTTNDTAKDPVKDTSNDTMKETADDSMDTADDMKEAADDSIKDTADDIKEAADDTMKETVDDTTRETADDSKKEASDDTMKKTVDDAMNQTADVTIIMNETADDTMNETADDTMNETADDTINETIDTDVSSSENPKKKFKWIKMIKCCLKSTEDKTASVKQLIKVLLPKYTEQTGEECSKKEFQNKLEKRLSSNFSYENGTVSMSC